MPRREHDVWQDPKFVMSFSRATIQVLYLTRAQIEEQFKAGKISKSDYDKYWKGVKAEHLEEVAIFLQRPDWEKLKEWERTWRHKGKDDYELGAFAVRSGGANQSRDPLNVFFLRM